MSKVENQLNRMKAMMNYGLQTESKTPQYSSVEYQKLAADGKTYGIVREGTKFYIKVSDSQKANLLKEDFAYIGGFRNRKNNEYSSYANALKNFDMKMISLKESTGNKTLMVESWNPEKNEYLMVEATDSMKREIARQKQIMANASMIMEKKSCSCEGGECSCKTDNIQVLPKGKGGDIFTEKPTQPEGTEGATTAEKNNIGKAQSPKKGKGVNEGDEHWAWHKTGGDAQETIADTDLDTSNGTEIGSGAPFEKCPKSETNTELKNGTVEEGTSMAMDNGDNQNSPKVGVGPIGDKAPFDGEKGTQIDEAEEGEDVMDDEPTDDDFGGAEDDFEGDDDFEGEDFEDSDDDFEGEDFDSDLGDEEPLTDEPMDDDLEDNSEIEDLKNEIEDLKSLLYNIADAVGVSSEDQADVEFGDDTLYDDDNVDDFDSEDFDSDLDDDDFEGDFEDEDFEGEDDFKDEDDDDVEVFESRSYRRMKALNEDKLNYFGKHPAWRKHPMQLPKTGADSNEHGRDWNDESVHGEQPYGEKIGSSAPFEIDPAAIENAIAESVKKILGNKRNF